MPEEARNTTPPGEAQQPQEPISLTEAIEERLAALEARIAALSPPAPVTPVEDRIAALSAGLDRITAALATQEETHTVTGLGEPPRSRVWMGRTGLEQVEAALDALISGTRPPIAVSSSGV